MSFTDAHVGDLAAALVDNQLDSNTRDEVLLHLGRCPGCRNDVEEQRQLKARLHALGTPGLPSGLIARLGAMSLPELATNHPSATDADPDANPDADPESDSELLASITFLGAHTPPPRKPSLLRNPQRGRRMLVGAASLLLVGAGTAVAAGGDGQSAPVSPSGSTFSTSFSAPIAGARNESDSSSVRLTDPAFSTMTASFRR